jgi:hypothetical protein
VGGKGKFEKVKRRKEVKIGTISVVDPQRPGVVYCLAGLRVTPIKVRVSQTKEMLYDY